MADEQASKHRNDVAIVIIGRNEGDRLRRSLASVAGARHVIYVDSGSTDDSLAIAAAAGVRTIALGEGRHSAARGRNAGLAAIDDPAVAYVQMIDGDCMLDPGWIRRAAAALDEDAARVAVLGQRREAAPGHSIYNRLCDVEWAVPAGEAGAFGGDVLLRRDAAMAVRGYAEDMIAGEDIDLALRLRDAGGHIYSLEAAMTRHDAAIDRFGQWWRRTARAGHAYAELAARHPEPAGAPYRRSVARILFWGGLLPLAMLLGIVSGALWLSAGAVVLVLLQGLRIFVRERQRRGARLAVAMAWYLTVGKYAEMSGIVRFWMARLRGARPGLIEYKGGAAA